MTTPSRDVVLHSDSGVGASSDTFNGPAVAAAASVVYIVVMLEDNSTPPLVSTLTYDGVGATFIQRTTSSQAAHELWVVTSPPTGAKEVIVTLASAITDRFVTTVESFLDTNTTNPHRGSPVQNDTSGTVTVMGPTNISSATGDLVVDWIGLNSASTGMATSEAGQSLSYDTNPGSNQIASSDKAGAATVGMGWTWDTARQAVHSIVSLQPVAAGGVTDLAIDPAEVDEANVRGTFTNTPAQVELWRHTSSPATDGSKIQDLSADTDWIDNAANSTVGPSANTLYYYQVSEASGANPSNIVSQITAPAQPTDSFSQISGEANKLRVNATSFGTGATHGHIFYRDKVLGGAFTDLLQPVADFPYDLVGLQEGTTYEGYVLSRNDTDSVESGYNALVEAATWGGPRIVRITAFDFGAPTPQRTVRITAFDLALEVPESDEVPDQKLAVAFPPAPERYEQDNEQAFRREVEDLMTQVEGILARHGHSAAAITAGSFPSGVYEFPGEITVAGAVDAVGNIESNAQFVYTGTFASSNQIMDFGQSYGLYSDSTGAGTANTRLWLNTPDEGELLLGPRTGAEYLDQIRLKARRFTFESDGSTGGAGAREVDFDADLGVRIRGNVGFYATAPIAQQTGVAVTDAAIHAALVALGLITA